MTLCKNPDAKGQSIVHVCCVLYMMWMQFKPGEAVAPNSPKKIVPDPCPTYRYLDEDDDGNSKCRRCSQCPKGFQVASKCSIYNDTKCEQCPSGWYNDVSGSRCKPCSGCKPGEYIRRECSTKRDTSCRRCPRYTFSVSSNSSRCVPCRTCRRNEERLLKCNSSHDTVCGDCVKEYFRVSSTGSCLQCSHCPSKLQYRVVPECRDKLGSDNPNICWPGDTRLRSSNFYERPISSADITNGDILHTDTETRTDTIPFTLIFSLFTTIFGGTVFIIFTFICLRQVMPARYPSAMYEPSSIPLSSFVVSTSESVHNSFDSTVDQHNSIEHTYFPSADHMFYENTELKSEIPFQHTTNKCNNYIQESRPPRSRSDPTDVYSPDTHTTGYINTDTQESDISGYHTDESHFYQNKRHGTL